MVAIAERFDCIIQIFFGLEFPLMLQIFRFNCEIKILKPKCWRGEGRGFG